MECWRNTQTLWKELIMQSFNLRRSAGLRSRVLVAGFGTDQVEAIDTSTNHIVWETPVPQPHNIAITPDGSTGYAGSQLKGTESLAIIDLSTGTQTGSLPLDHTPRALNVSQ